MSYPDRKYVYRTNQDVPFERVTSDSEIQTGDYLEIIYQEHTGEEYSTKTFVVNYLTRLVDNDYLSLSPIENKVKKARAI